MYKAELYLYRMRDKGKGKEEEGLLKYNQKERSCMAKKIGKLDKHI